MKKFSAVAVIVASTLSSAAMADNGHQNFIGSLDKVLTDGFKVTDPDVAYNIGKYASGSAKLKLIEAFKDGELTAQEIRDSGISEHHFYTGYLSSSKNQKEYDAKLKELNGGQNMDDKFISNRDLKSYGTMIMTQVDGVVDGKIDFNNKVRDAKLQQAHDHYSQRMDNIVNGLQQLGDHVGQITPTVSPETKVYQVTDSNGKPVDGLIGYSYTDANGQTRTGYKVVKDDITYFDQDGVKQTVTGAGSNYDKLQGAVKEAIDTTALTEIGNALQGVGNKVNNVVEGLQNADWSSLAGDNSAAAVGGRVDKVVEGLKDAGNAISSNTGRIDALEGSFAAQAARTNEEIARLDGRIDQLEEKTDKMKAGIAGANAIASLTQYTGTGTHHVAVAIGGYDGAAALAGGYTYAIDKNTTVRATISVDSEKEVGFGASVGHSW